MWYTNWGVDESQVTEEADWVQLKAEPLDLDNLFGALELEFSTEGNKIVLSLEMASELNTVGDVVKYIEERLAEETAAA